MPLHKKILCLILAAVMCISSVGVLAFADETEPTIADTVPEGTQPVVEQEPTEGEQVPEQTPEEPAEPEGDGLLHISEEALLILKKEEGFSSKPYWDYSQWTIGYGTKCPDDMLQYYKQHGISENEAVALLKAHVVKFEQELHKFMTRDNLELTQNQFDALLLFTYNCGSGWTYDKTGTMYKAIVGGATGNDLIFAFSRWCSAGGKILTHLLRRRLCESNMYLNGVYSQTPPDNYGYVIYDACGGTTSPMAQGYDTGLTAAILSTPTREGCTFVGWYTGRTDGTKVEVLDASVKNRRLYAHWVDKDGNEVTNEMPSVDITVTGTNVNLRGGPGTSYSIVGRADKGDQFTITEVAEGSGYTWGKYADGGWICLKYTNYDEVKDLPQTTPETPPAQEPEKEPETPPVQEPAEPPVQEPETEPEQTAPKTQMGTVKVSDSLRIRKGPSTGYEVAGYLKNGDRVEILEQKIVGSMVWGRISKGWISLSYVVLDKAEPETKPETKPEPKPETKPEPQPETKPQEPEEKPAEPQKVIATGTVKVNDFLRIRSGPGTSYSLVDYLTRGARVEILEMKQSESMTWGKIERGWISLDYVVLDKTAEQQPATVITGTVKVNDFLRIRTGAGTSYAIAGYLQNGVKVQITEQKTVGLTKWGKIEKGWISLDYVVLDTTSAAPESQPEEKPATTIKTVTADCLRIRSNAGTSYSIVGYLYEGAKVEILETKSVNGTQWGKTAKGWISMDYVK